MKWSFCIIGCGWATSQTGPVCPDNQSNNILSQFLSAVRQDLLVPSSDAFVSFIFWKGNKKEKGKKRSMWLGSWSIRTCALHHQDWWPPVSVSRPPGAVAAFPLCFILLEPTRGLLSICAKPSQAAEPTEQGCSLGCHSKAGCRIKKAELKRLGWTEIQCLYIHRACFLLPQ